jgi:hypothetical protein
LSVVPTGTEHKKTDPSPPSRMVMWAGLRAMDVSNGMTTSGEFECWF